MNTATEGSSNLAVIWGLFPLSLVDMLHVTGGGVLRASPSMLSMLLQTIKFIAKKSKCVNLAEEIDFSAPNLCSLLWLVKGTTQLYTSKNECNKLDLIAAQYF